MSPGRPEAARVRSDSGALVEAERSGHPFLVFRDGDDRQGTLLLVPGSVAVTVGRQASSDLAFEWDAQVSRLHARLEGTQDEGWVIVDDGLSSNGTFVNDERVSGRRPLNDGDILRFGSTMVLFRAPVPARSVAGEDAGTPAAVQLSSTQLRVLTGLCRPCLRSASAKPATDLQIADELVISVSEVQAHLRVLYAKLGIDAVRSSEPRSRLVNQALSTGLISQRDA